MAVKLGNTNIIDIRKGDIVIGKVYNGNDLVYQKNIIRKSFIINSQISIKDQINEFQELFKSIYKFNINENTEYGFMVKSKINGEYQNLSLNIIFNSVLYFYNISLLSIDNDNQQLISIFDILSMDVVTIEKLMTNFNEIINEYENENGEFSFKFDGILNIEIIE